MLIEGDSPVIQKLNGIHEAGTAALRAGSVEPFTGYPESLKNRFGVYFKYTQPAEQLVRKQVLDEVTKIGQDLGIGLFVAGHPVPDGHPIHTTVLEGLCQESSPMDREELFDMLSKLGLKTLRGVLFDDFYSSGALLQFKFDTVVVDKVSMLLAATQIPQQVIDLRDELSWMYSLKWSSLKPLPLDNLLHMTLTRITKTVHPSHADEYIERMEALHQKVAENPLTLQVRTLARGSAYDLLNDNITPWFGNHHISN